jgi:hypothetical protein
MQLDATSKRMQAYTNAASGLRRTGLTRYSEVRSANSRVCLTTGIRHMVRGCPRIPDQQQSHVQPPCLSDGPKENTDCTLATTNVYPSNS